MVTRPRQFYVYTLSRPPTDNRPNEVFYIGKGTKSRVFDHEEETVKGIKSKKCDVIRDIWAQGGQVQKTILYATFIERDALIYEWFLIHVLFSSGNLTNVKLIPKQIQAHKRIIKTRSSSKLGLPLLKQHRMKLGLSQEGLARRTRDVSSRIVRSAEDGKRVTFDTAVQILEGLNVALTEAGKSTVTLDDLGLISC